VLHYTTTAVHLVLALLGGGPVCWSFRGLPWTASRLLGLALAISSLSLWLTARIQLGRSFAVRAQAKELVTHGLYSKIRNPIYLFGSLCLAGLCLLLNQPIGLLVLLVVAPLQAMRARKEARVLEEKFGDAYRQYRARTWF
jgi:protein-S-isoprenylcysteine O-methyltransferase Ste14